MTSRKSSLPLILMMIWFAVLGVVSGGIALIGLAFSNEPGGRGNPSIIDYAIIFGPLLTTALLAGLCVFFWKKGNTSAAYLACAAPVLIFALFAVGFGI